MRRSFVILTVILPLVSLGILLRILTDDVKAEPHLVEVGGVLTEDTVWTAVNSPYILTSTIQIPPGITLTVEPGVTVFGQSFAGIAIEGNIVAIGTPTSPITFTSLMDSAPGKWPGLFFWDGSGHFENASIRYGGEQVADPIDGVPQSGANVNVIDKTDKPGRGELIFRNSTIYGSSGFGIVIPSINLFRFELDNVTFSENITDRVQLITYSSTPMTGTVTLSPQPGLEGYETTKIGLIIADGTLTLAPGTTLFIPYRSGIVLQHGDLEANGTAENPVTITSVSDTDVDRWGGILVWFGSAQLYHTQIRFAGEDIGYDTASALQLYEITSGKEFIIENSTFYSSSNYPIAIEIDNLHQLKMANNSFVENAQNRIQLLSDPDTNEITLVDDAILPGQDNLTGYELAAPGLIVPEGVTLTAGAGATVLISDSVGIEINGGHLEASGTAADPILFTSLSDSGPGEWVGLTSLEGTIQLSHAEIRYATDGLFVQGGAVTAVCTTFFNNSNAGIYATNEGDLNLTIANSNIYGNGNFGLFNNNSAQVDARNNWWGDPTGPAGIGSGMGDAVQGNVLFSPWQTEVTCSTPYFLYLPNVLMP